MREVVDVVSRALRRRLLRDGARSMTDAERNLPRVSHFLDALEHAAVNRLFADMPLTEIAAFGYALDVISTPGIAQQARAAATKVAAASDPDRGLERPAIVAAATARLATDTAPMIREIPNDLFDYAFTQHEVAPDPPTP